MGYISSSSYNIWYEFCYSYSIIYIVYVNHVLIIYIYIDQYLKYFDIVNIKIHGWFLGHFFGHEDVEADPCSKTKGSLEKTYSVPRSSSILFYYMACDKVVYIFVCLYAYTIWIVVYGFIVFWLLCHRWLDVYHCTSHHLHT